MLEKREFYIDGRWVSPAIANDFEVIDPSNEEPCAVISLGDQADTDAAVAAANAAFAEWSVTPKAERLALVERILEVYLARADEMAEA
ncbi:MAG: aldehyde dehydrogenase family protein, partial [Limibaculum sp.]